MRKSLVVGFNVGIWYSSSVVCAVLSKKLLREGLSPDVLTLFQLTIGCAIARATLFLRKTKVDHLSKQMNRYIITLAFAFTIGFKTLNTGLSVMAVAFCMTLRVTEPIFTWVISKVLALLSIHEHPSKFLLVPLIVIVVGAVLSVWSSSQVNAFGLCAIFISNTCFALRSIITKRVQKEQSMDPFLIFYHICKFGVMNQVIWLLVFSVVFGSASIPTLNLPVLLLNGAIWYIYLQFSTIVNFLVNAITHTTLNAIRQTTVITASAVVMGYKLSWLNKMGIVIACFGSIMYSYIRRSDKTYLFEPLPQTEDSFEVELGDENIGEYDQDNEDQL
jgi:hypothetical protein